MADAKGEPQPTYEEARDELTTIVAKLEAGGTTLEQSLALWERGEVLAAICQNWLDGARQRLDEATDAGVVATGAFDDNDDAN